MECVVKVFNKINSTITLLSECHFMKFLSHEDYICKVLEEIYVYDTDERRLHSGVAIIERAECDLL